MLLIDELKTSIAETERLIAETGQKLDLPKLQAELADLKKKQEAPDFFADMAAAQRVNKRASDLETEIGEYGRLNAQVKDLRDFLALAEAENDGKAMGDVETELRALGAEAEKLYLSTMLSGEYDRRDAIVTVHSGAGGTESCDWADMLYRMYGRWCERAGYKTKLLDFQDGDGAGLKSATFAVTGVNAYGYLKAEKGVHRLVRISPFDANKRRHTSFASVEVMPEIENDTEIEIRGEDLKIDTYRSSGAGGQHVNKTESAIRITHLPTGLVAACQNERSQIQNRETAMKMLRSRLIELKERENTERAAGIKGEIKRIEWGSQIRSYVFCPYTMVKDHRTGYETSDVAGVMDGGLDAFIFEYLKKI
ncbi:MAG: peptide chain release factor 2 [Clostridiales bacterium]|jgi:peptide chain release factor 2|nr:peptide chain release factor 2 [Clostridiales bacterium]